MDEDITFPERALTSRKRKSLNDARQMLKKGFQVDAYEDLAFQ